MSQAIERVKASTVYSKMKSDTHTRAEFDQLVQKTIEDWKVPGVAIAIVHKDEIFVKVFLIESHSQV